VFIIIDGTAYWYREFPYEQKLTKHIAEEDYFKSITSFP